jgi:predicted Zn-dependent protease
VKAALWITLAAVTVSAQTPQIGRGVNFYSVQKEAALGASMAAEFQGQVTPIDSAAVRDFVNRIGSRLSAQIPGAPFPFTFAVIAGDLSSATHEPVALPGGYIFVPAELILAANDEAELAGMLAHSMVHVAERHATRTATRAEIAGQATIPLLFQGGWTGYGIRQTAGVQIPIGFLQFQRGLETRADQLAVAISSAAGYDPSALVRYIGRMRTNEPGTTSKVFSAMPLPADRVSSMQTAIQALPQQTYTVPDADEFARIQAEVRRLAPAKPVAALYGQRPALKRAN